MNPADVNSNTDIGDVESTERPSIVTDLTELVRAGHKFTTVLADPPWRVYGNQVERRLF